MTGSSLRCVRTRRSRSSSRSAIGYYFGKFTYKGIGLGSVTATLIAGVVIGQIGITINQPLKAFSFLMFLFAVGYGVGPQFVRGIASTGLPQAIFSVVQCVFSLLACVVIAKIAGYDLGYSAGFYSGSQTISAAMGLSTDAINRLGMAAEEAKALLDSMPIAYAVTYMFGTMGSAVVIAVLGPKLLGIDLVAACKDYEEKHGGGKKEVGGVGTAWHRWVLRAYKVQPGGKAAGLRAAEAEAMVPDARLFIQRIRRDGQIIDATADTVLKEGDVVAIAGEREVTGEGAARGGGSRRPGAAGRAGRGRRRPGDEQGSRRQDAGRAGPEARGARRFPAQDHARRDRDRYPHPAEYRDQSRRPAHPRRPHAGHRRRHQAAGRRRPSDRRHRHGVRRRGDRGRRADRRAGLQGGRGAADAVDRRRRARSPGSSAAGCARCARPSGASRRPRSGS